MATKRKSGLISLALAFCPSEFRAEFGEQIHADADQQQNRVQVAINVAAKGITLHLESLGRDAVFAVRILCKTPVLTTAAVATLAVAISVNAAVFGAINTVLLKPLPFVQPGSLAFICQGIGKYGSDCNIPFSPYYMRFVAKSRGLGEIAAYQLTPVAITGLGIPESTLAAVTSVEFFDALRVRPEAGRFFAAADGQRGVRNAVISDRVWRNLYGGNIRILGRTISLNGLSWRVIGVAPRTLVMPNPDSRRGPQSVDVFEALPINTSNWGLNEHAYAGDSFGATVFMRLNGKSTQATAQVELDRIAAQVTRQTPEARVALNAVLFTEWYRSDQTQRVGLLIALLMAFAVLLIACANLASILLARGAARFGEVAIRSALGATRSRIIHQLIVEIAILASLGGVLGIALAYIEIKFLLGLAPGLLPRMQAVVDWPVLLYTCLMVVIVILLAGIFPAYLTTRNLATVLNSHGRGPRRTRGASARSLLVVAQISLAFAMVVTSVSLAQSFNALTHSVTGFDPRNVYVAIIDLLPKRFTVPAARIAFVNAVIARLRYQPGVEAVAISRGIPFLNGTDDNVWIKVPGQRYELPPVLVTPKYFDVLKIPIIRGRPFNDGDLAASPSVIMIDAEFARRFMHSDNPTGKRLPMRSGSTQVLATIVGVVDPSLTGYYRDGGGIGTLYAPYAQHPSELIEVSMRMRHDDPHLRSEVGAVVASVDRNTPVTQFTSFSERLRQMWAPQYTIAVLLGVMATIALVLALIGVYAIVSYASERRTHEFGIRKAVGARTIDIIRIVLPRALYYAFAGILLGIEVTALSVKALRTLLIDSSPLNLMTLLSVSALVVVSTFAAVAIPTIRAMRVDPAEALRYE